MDFSLVPGLPVDEIKDFVSILRSVFLEIKGSYNMLREPGMPDLEITSTG